MQSGDLAAFNGLLTKYSLPGLTHHADETARADLHVAYAGRAIDHEVKSTECGGPNQNGKPA